MKIFLLSLLFGHSMFASAKIFGSKHNDDGTFIILYNAQQSLNLLEIVYFIREKKLENTGKAMYPQVVVFVWDCKARVDGAFGFWDSKSKKRKALKECNEDTEKMSASMYQLQQLSVDHSQAINNLNHFKPKLQSHQIAYHTFLQDLEQEKKTNAHLTQLKESLNFFITHYDKTHKLLAELRQYLAENPNQQIDNLISNFIYSLNTSETEFLNVFKNFAKAIQFLNFQESMASHELAQEIYFLLTKNRTTISTSIHSIIEVVNPLIQKSHNRIQSLQIRGQKIKEKQSATKKAIADNQEYLLRKWEELTNHDQREQLSFIESIPDFSFSFKLYPMKDFLY